MSFVRRLIVIAAIAIGTIGLLVGSILPALAAPLAKPAPAPVPNTGQGLEISPPLMELRADPGSTITANIRIRNVTKGDLVVTGKADDFGAKGEEGEPQILLDETEATRYSLKFWVAGVPSFRLVPQEVKTAQIKIVLPANAEPGGHYGVIRFTGTPPELEGTGVALSASIGTLVLMRVNGEITEKLSVKDFYATKNDKRGNFFETGPIKLVERIHNDGSVHVKPVGYVSIFNTFGQRIAHVPISNPARNVLPDSTRRFEQTLPGKHLFGRYRAQFSAEYGATKQKLTSQNLTFWVIPWKLILLLLLILLILIWLMRGGIKRYNRYIVGQARRQ